MGKGGVVGEGVGGGSFPPSFPHHKTNQPPPDDCQELLNGWHNFSFELMDVSSLVWLSVSFLLGGL